MEYFNKMDGSGGYVRASLLGLSQGMSPLHDPLRFHHPALHSQIPDKDGLLRPLSEYPLHLLPFHGSPFLPPPLPFSASAFHPLHKLSQPPTSSVLNSNSTNTSLCSTIPGSAFAPIPSKSSKLQADTAITSTGLFSHNNLLASLDQQRTSFLGGPSPTSINGAPSLEDRRDSPSPRGSHGSRESPGQARDASSPISPGEARKRYSGDALCPVCQIPVRSGEIEAHLALEIEKLSRLPIGRNVSYRSSTPTSMISGTTSLPVSSPHSPNIPSIGRARDPGWETYQRVRASRQVRVRAKKRRKEEPSTCRFCNERVLFNSTEELQLHIEQCMRRAYFGALQQNAMEDEEVDVEGDPAYEETEWPLGRRQRAVLQRLTSSNKDGDPEVSSEKEVTSATPEKGGCDSVGERETDSSKDTVKMSDLLEKECESLKQKLRVLEKNAALPPKYQCQTCHSSYEQPCVSMVCWHVFCQNCWPHGINTKGECPQCSQTYSSEDIRPIHL